MSGRGGEDEGEGYLGKCKRVRHRSHQDLAQFSTQVRTFNAVQVRVHPEDPTHTHTHGKDLLTQ